MLYILKNLSKRINFAKFSLDILFVVMINVARVPAVDEASTFHPLGEEAKEKFILEKLLPQLGRVLLLIDLQIYPKVIISVDIIQEQIYGFLLHQLLTMPVENKQKEKLLDTIALKLSQNELKQ